MTLAVTSYLRELRIRKGVSQNQLSQLSGISRSGLGHIESGNVLPSFANILRISGALEITIEEVLSAVEIGE
jgi:transcriptional regulator with XRE-family HTH domain